LPENYGPRTTCYNRYHGYPGRRSRRGGANDRYLRRARAPARSLHRGQQSAGYASLARGARSSYPSPDPNTSLRRQPELVGRLHAECVIPSVHVSDDAVDPELLRSVRIRHQLLTDRVLRGLLAPGLGEAEKKALVAGEPADHCRWPAQERMMIR